MLFHFGANSTLGLGWLHSHCIPKHTASLLCCQTSHCDVSIGNFCSSAQVGVGRILRSRRSSIKICWTVWRWPVVWGEFYFSVIAIDIIMFLFLFPFLFVGFGFWWYVNKKALIDQGLMRKNNDGYCFIQVSGINYGLSFSFAGDSDLMEAYQRLLILI